MERGREERLTLPRLVPKGGGLAWHGVWSYAARRERKTVAAATGSGNCGRSRAGYIPEVVPIAIGECDHII
jgi:hypothetical protein